MIVTATWKRGGQTSKNRQGRRRTWKLFHILSFLEPCEGEAHKFQFTQPGRGRQWVWQGGLPHNHPSLFKSALSPSPVKYTLPHPPVFNTLYQQRQPDHPSHFHTVTLLMAKTKPLAQPLHDNPTQASHHVPAHTTRNTTPRSQQPQTSHATVLTSILQQSSASQNKQRPTAKSNTPIRGPSRRRQPAGQAMDSFEESLVHAMEDSDDLDEDDLSFKKYF